ncbi:hypothetical protein MLD38_008612 [Melastoma candidum]|uniref:Uncharacterized protein n=1 Tax=Melastoma candidum TaxID=119954 RepID=A0ACB9RWR8_9MYRT|nr:hypothetical protein MLD38_008612 [Melastoma candidum]
MKAVESSPAITLEIAKGPRDGETFTYYPSTNPVVRIGRLVRGNTLAIKDSGISSKHLILQFDPDSCKWVLTDLDSSNGTFLNGSSARIEPGKGYVIRDGDSVKIGECTDFVCKFCGGGGIEESCDGGGRAGLRRNPRRRGALGEGKDGVRVLGEIGDGNGVGEGSGVLEEKCPPVRRKGQRKGGGVVEAKGKENSEVIMASESRKFGKLKEEMNLQERKRKQLGENPEIVVEESKRRRGGRKDNVLTGVVIKTEHLDEPIEVERLQVVEDVAVAARASTRRTRGAKKEEKSLDMVLENDGSVHGDEMVVNTKTRTGLRSQRRIGKNVRVVDESERLDVIEEVGGDASENKESKDIQDSIRDGEIEPARDLPAGNGESCDIDEEKECVDPSIQKGSTACDNTGVRNETGSEAKVDAMMTDQTPDLSQITVREWLDWLEVNLPKQIIAETEKLIAEMRSKAQRVKEYRAEQMMKREGV